MCPLKLILAILAYIYLYILISMEAEPPLYVITIYVPDNFNSGLITVSPLNDIKQRVISRLKSSVLGRHEEVRWKHHGHGVVMARYM